MCLTVICLSWLSLPSVSIVFQPAQQAPRSSTTASLFSASHLAVVYKYITAILAGQMTCHLPQPPRSWLPLITPQFLAYYSHSPPRSKLIENMAEALLSSIIVHCFGVYASWVARFQSEVDGVCNDARHFEKYAVQVNIEAQQATFCSCCCKWKAQYK